MAVFKIHASRVNNTDAATFQGQINEEGQIWYGPDGTLRIYNGNPGWPMWLPRVITLI